SLLSEAAAGIRACQVTGVQTCALPISGAEHVVLERPGLLTLQNHMFGPGGFRPGRRPPPSPPGGPPASRRGAPRACTAPGRRREIGRASCRERDKRALGRGGARRKARK